MADLRQLLLLIGRSDMDNKKIATQFLESVVKGKIDEAYDKFVDFKGKHHNMFFPAGFDKLCNAMKDAHIQFPKKKFTIKNIFGEDDMIAIHSHIMFGVHNIAVVHMFRFEKGKIVEMWDCGQEIPKNMPNKDGAF